MARAQCAQRTRVRTRRLERPRRALLGDTLGVDRGSRTLENHSRAADASGRASRREPQSSMNRAAAARPSQCPYCKPPRKLLDRLLVRHDVDATVNGHADAAHRLAERPADNCTAAGQRTEQTSSVVQRRSALRIALWSGIVRTVMLDGQNARRRPDQASGKPSIAARF